MRIPALLTIAALGCALLTGCGDDGPDTDALTKALRSGDFGAVTVDDRDKVEQAYDAITEGMGELEPSVKAGEPRVAKTSAHVPLTWRWPVGDDAWTYRTEADFERVGESWKLRWKPSLVNGELRGDDDRLRAQRILPKRGEIRGARGALLVRERPVETYGIDKARVDSTAAAVRSAKALARVVDVDAEGFVKRVRSAGPKAYVEAITYRKGGAPQGAASKASDILGALVVPGEQPLAPTKEFAAPILGSVGPVTAEMMKKQPGVFRVGDRAGVTGLQARYDERLRGSPGITIDVIHGEDGSGGEDEIFSLPADQGRSLQTTLDVRLQLAAERILAHTGPASALVAIRPRDGAVLAAASGPGAHGVNIATYGQAAPGSTFKTASSLALLREGLKPTSTVDCPRTATVDGKRFRNDSWFPASALGSVPLTTAIAQSCNTAMVGARDRVSHQDLADAAASLGFGIDHDLGFPAYFGQIPEPGSETGHAAELIGQGQVLASPMAMATMMASIQAGDTVVPHLLEGVDGLDTEVPKGVERLTPAETRQLKTIFHGVVTDGTGRGLADVPGGPVIAKTGTAEFDRDGRRLTHTWMIAAQGDLAVAVYVDEGENGSATSGPLLEQFLRAAQ